MSSRVAKRTGASVAEIAAVSLRVVLDESQVMASADVTDMVGIGALAVEMYNHYGTCSGSYRLLNACVVNLERVDARLDEHWLQVVLGDGEYGCDVCVGRHDYLVAVLHYAHLLVGTQNECKGVKSVAATYAVSCSDEAGELFAERLVLCSLQIPSAVYNALHGFAYLATVLRCNKL